MFGILPGTQRSSGPPNGCQHPTQHAPFPQPRREQTTQLLLQPLYASLTSTLSRLRSGAPWSSIHGTALEQSLLHGMARTRALLDALLLAARAAAALVERAAERRGGGQADVDGAAASGADLMESGATSAADAVDDLAARAARLTTAGGAAAAVTAAVAAFGGVDAGAAGRQEEAGPGGRVGGGVGQGLNDSAAAAAVAAAAAAAAGANGSADAHHQQQRQQQDPLISLLVSEVWPLAQALCLEGASGRFLHQYAKSTVLLLRARPDALLPLLPQLLDVCEACYCQPGGYSLGDVLSGVIATYCRVEGSKAPLDCTPHVLQVGGL